MKNARSSSLKARWFVASVAMAAMALVVVFLPSSTAVAQQGGTGGLGNGGVLQLHLGSNGNPQDYFGFRDASGAGYANSFAQTQSISTVSGCRLSLNPASSLVTITSAPTGSNPGFVSDSIGVRTNSEGNGQPCGRIDAPQALTLNLAKSGKMIDYAELDIELKFSGALSIQGYIGNTAVGSVQNYTSVGSDSGPDSGDADNYRIRFPKSGSTLVNKLVLTATTGGASLEGGADGTQVCDPTDAGECGGTVGFSLGQTLGTTDSLFHLVNVDGVLDCGDSASQSGGSGAPTNDLTREDDVGGGCGAGIPYNLESGPGVTPGCDVNSLQCILLQKNLLDPNAQFTWTVTWAPESAQYPETPTQFDFDLDGTFQAIQPCLADSDDDGLPQLPPTLNQSDPASAVDPWCVMDTSNDFNPATGQYTVTETYYGAGDPGGKRA